MSVLRYIAKTIKEDGRLTERLLELRGVDDSWAGLASESTFLEARVERRIVARVVGCFREHTVLKAVLGGQYVAARAGASRRLGTGSMYTYWWRGEA